MRFALLLLLLSANAPTALGDGLRVGAASVDITPELGTPMSGYYFERGAEGVHDPLFAKAIVLEVDGTRAVFGLARPEHDISGPGGGCPSPD